MRVVQCHASSPSLPCDSAHRLISSRMWSAPRRAGVLRVHAAPGAGNPERHVGRGVRGAGPEGAHHGRHCLHLLRISGQSIECICSLDPSARWLLAGQVAIAWPSCSAAPVIVMQPEVVSSTQHRHWLGCQACGRSVNVGAGSLCRNGAVQLSAVPFQMLSHARCLAHPDLGWHCVL